MDVLALYLICCIQGLSCFVKIDSGSAEHVVGIITGRRTERRKLEKTLSRQERKIKLSAPMSC